jgi:hypothetical protein
MSNHEKHPIRDGIIATVVGGIVLTILLTTWKWFLVALNGIVGLAINIWGFSISKVQISWGIILLLMILSLPTILRFVKKFIPKSEKGNILRKNDYTEDEFFGVIWRWDSDETIGFCPNCQTRLVYNLGYGYQGMETSLYCETCERTITKLDGNHQDVLGKVARQIEKKVNTGEWKQVVESKKKSER